MNTPPSNTSDTSDYLILRYNPTRGRHRKVAVIWQELIRTTSLIRLTQIEDTSIDQPIISSSRSNQPEIIYDQPFEYQAIFEFILEMMERSRNNHPLIKSESSCPTLIKYGTSFE